MDTCKEKVVSPAHASVTEEENLDSEVCLADVPTIGLDRYE